MSAARRTLEEIEAAIDLAVAGGETREYEAAFYAPDLLAIAQGQREEMERLRRLRDEVAKMAWPAGATYCAALLDALNATMSEPHDIGKAIGTKK